MVVIGKVPEITHAEHKDANIPQQSSAVIPNLDGMLIVDTVKSFVWLWVWDHSFHAAKFWWIHEIQYIWGTRFIGYWFVGLHFKKEHVIRLRYNY